MPSEALQALHSTTRLHSIWQPIALILISKLCNGDR